MGRVFPKSNRHLTVTVSLAAWAVWGVFFAKGLQAQDNEKSAQPTESKKVTAPATNESRFITDVFQLTYEGKRSGEGYFGADGKKLIYQSEQEPDNPFYQIYLFDFERLESTRVSPGHGKTTCSWMHPDGTKALYASTQNDPDAIKKQKEELAFRESGQERRYAWDYDETYDLIEYDFKAKTYKSLTTERGYDAEGSYSPDGKLIAFASNRRGYEGNLSDEEKKAFELDPAYFMDIYIMNADGTEVRQLTDVPGYDGGPFFSADGKKICWRRFSVDGLTAEIFTMNVDGSEQKQITNMRAMSWAPYFHPSGKYLVFTTNKMGFDNFELFLVDAEGKGPPVRLTTTMGFDGLATWDRTGERLTWTSNRSADGLSQIFIANWNHQAALQALGLTNSAADSTDVSSATQAAEAAAQETVSDYTPVDFRKHVEYLCQADLGGRMTGSPGERKATAYVAAYMDYLGLKPDGDEGSWFQAFEFPAGAKLTEDNLMFDGSGEFKLDADWRPLTFSANGDIEASEIVFAGYGLVVPEEDGVKAYDSYSELDVTGKWVMMFRYFPEDVDDKTRQQYVYSSNLRKKVMDARDRGAKGVIIVSGPNSNVGEQLIPMSRDFSLSGSSIAAISISDRVAQEWLSKAGKDLKSLQDELDAGKPVEGISIPDVTLKVRVGIEQQTGVGRNVLGRLMAGDQPSAECVVVGAHVDHLGTGRSSSSLARNDETTMVHFGADDNASGVAAMLEIAEHLARLKAEGSLPMKRDIVFAAWSGEELGLQGSQYFIKTFEHTLDKESAYPEIAACLNMDMVGRYDGTLILQGIASSDYWKKATQKNAATRLNLKLSNDTSLPTDASSFYQAGVPILSAFTGSHQDYHTPRDTPEKLKYDEASRIARLMGLIAQSLVSESEPPKYRENKASQSTAAPRANMRAFVGTVPDYAGGGNGVLLSGTVEGSPAEAAGIKSGDIVIELAGRKIESIQEYAVVLGALKPDVQTTIVVERDGERVELKLTPGRRER